MKYVATILCIVLLIGIYAKVKSHPLHGVPSASSSPVIQGNIYSNTLLGFSVESPAQTSFEPITPSKESIFELQLCDIASCTYDSHIFVTEAPVDNVNKLSATYQRDLPQKSEVTSISLSKAGNERALLVRTKNPWRPNEEDVWVHIIANKRLYTFLSRRFGPFALSPQGTTTIEYKHNEDALPDFLKTFQIL